MRILTITFNDLGISWGPAIHFLELWNNVSSLTRGVLVEGIAPSWTGAEPIIEPAFRLRTAWVPNVRSWRQVYFDAVVAGRLLLSWRRYDLVYVRLGGWHPLLTMLLALLKLPYVLELNGLAAEDSVSSRKGRVIRAITSVQERWLVAHAAVVVAVSRGIAEAVQARYRPRGKVVTIHNGVAEHFFPAAAPRERSLDRPTAIYVGTFTPWDGAGAVVSLARQFPKVRFLMVGDGPARLALAADAPENVEFTGYVNYSELPAIYGTAECAIVLYEYERHRHVEVSSLKTREYLACGLPIFTTDIPGQEFVDRLGVGMLLPRDQDVGAAFAEFLRALPEYYRAYERLGARLKEEIGWAHTAKETLRSIAALNPAADRPVRAA
jgi:glycosyltransferase involved in cell wall biosynthesis